MKSTTTNVIALENLGIYCIYTVYQKYPPTTHVHSETMGHNLNTATFGYEVKGLSLVELEIKL